MTYYERHLPHWHPDGTAVFLTWRLFGSLPRERAFEIAKGEPAGRSFAAIDQELARAGWPRWLEDPRIAQLVEILGRSGQAFWQNESYDHWVRNAEELEKIVRYIESNPVAAGLVNKVEDWRWSSGWSGQEAYPTGRLQ